MSTKIYSAFRLAPGIEIFSFAQRMRGYCYPLIQKEISETYVHTAVLRWDQTDDDVSFVDVLKEVIKESRSREDNFFPERWFSASASFFRNPVRDEMYVMLHNVPYELNERFLEFEGVEGDFSYWDSSDSQVEELGYDGWKDRLKAWKETIDFRRSLGQQGLSIQFMDQLYARAFFSVDTVEKYWDQFSLPSYDKRFSDVFARVFLKHHPLSQDDIIPFVSRTSRSSSEQLEKIAAFFGASPEQFIAVKNETQQILATKNNILL